MVCVLRDRRSLSIASLPLPLFLVSFLFFLSLFFLSFFFFSPQKSMLLSKQHPPRSVQPSALWPDNKPIPVFALVASCPSDCRSNKCLRDVLVRARILKMCPFHFQSRLGRCCTAVWERRSGGNSAAPRLSIIMYISLSTGVTCDLFYRSLWLFLTLSNRCSLFFSRSLSRSLS